MPTTVSVMRHVDAVPAGQIQHRLAGLDALGGLLGDRDGLLERHAAAEVGAEGVVAGQRRGAGRDQVAQAGESGEGERVGAHGEARAGWSRRGRG